MDLQKEITTALSRAMAEAVPSTPSGSHKIMVVGQVVVNVDNSQPKIKCPKRICCGDCNCND